MIHSGSVAQAAERLTDGAWHRLHPATPLLKGGIGFIAVLGVVLANLRERLIDLFVSATGGNPDHGGGGNFDGDPIDQIYDRGLVGWALLVLVVVLLLAIGAFYLSWRMHTFRVGEDAVEVRSGILFRRHRSARLDRIQGVNVSRHLFARLFGVAKLEVSVAGQDANVELSYLSSALADGLRRDILRRASGIRSSRSASERSEVSVGVAGATGATTDAVTTAEAAATAVTTAEAGSPAGGRLNRRVSEFFAPELDPDAAPPVSVVRIPPLRLFGSLLLSGFTVFLVLVVGLLVVGTVTGHYWLLFVVLPGLLGSASFYINRFTKSLRYSIAGTPDGVRVGFGLLSTSNETLPPGRIHAVEVVQPLLWRPFNWWQIRIDTAGHSKQKGASGQPNTTMLPVGNVADVGRVLSLVLPEFSTEAHRGLIEAGMMAPGGDSFIPAPRRAAWLRPFSWRRTGYTIVDGVILLRHGIVWRHLALVPLARLQSIEVTQGPIDRWLRLAGARMHTVEGPVHPRLAVIDRDQAVLLFTDVAAEAIASADRDTSHRWNAAAAVVERSVTEPADAPVRSSTDSANDEEGSLP